jgi:hypothetical protein
MSAQRGTEPAAARVGRTGTNSPFLSHDRYGSSRHNDHPENICQDQKPVWPAEMNLGAHPARGRVDDSGNKDGRKE